MKVLIANNYYYLRGGSERVFFQHCKLMRDNGHQIIPFSVKDERNEPNNFVKYFAPPMSFDVEQSFLNKFKTAARIIYSRNNRKLVSMIIQDFSPDVAHMHNIYGRISPSVLPELNSRGIPIFLTLHDYKLICPTYLLYRDGAVCEKCKGGKFYNCILHRCNKNSTALSVVSAMESYIHILTNTWGRNVTRFISPSLFLKKKLVDFGFKQDDITYIPNFLSLEKYEAQYENNGYLVYVGRLSKEKGVSTLIKAFKQTKSMCKLLVIGDGPLMEELKLSVESVAKKIYFSGYLSGNKLKESIRDAVAVVMPSMCYENAPLSILESFGFGKPVIGSRIGGIPEMIDEGVNGYLFEPGNVDDLREKIELMLSMSDRQIREMGQAARQKVEREYNSELHYERLMEIYHRALGKD